jgi:4-amino-4-deoxychorismate lyase
MNISRNLLFSAENEISISNLISNQASSLKALHKCRIIYGNEVVKTEFLPYTPKPIHSLKIVEENLIDYSLKYENRNQINKLFLQRQQCDDILIIKNGFVSDTSYCNIIFYDGEKYFTPTTALLKGCKRQSLLNKGIIQEDEIRLTDIRLFKKAILINSMIELEDNFEIPIQNII